MKNEVFLIKYPSPSDVERSFSPVFWDYTLANPEKAYMSDCPTLSNYDKVYGEDSSQIWVNGQITGLFGMSSEKDGTKAETINMFSKCFAKEVGLYKLSELMLFFGRYAAGRYDNCWQTFDTHKIGSAFFKEFLPQRQKELEIYEAKRNQENVSKDVEEWKKSSISYKEWLKIKEVEKTKDKHNIM